MVFENYKWQNNAETTFDANVSASSTTWFVKPGEWDLFKIDWSFEFPFLLTGEKFNAAEQVIGREVVKVTWSPAADQFTVVRQYEECVQNETADPKIISNWPQTFDSGDKISLYQTAWDNRDLKEEVVRINTDLTTNYATKDEVKKSSLVYGASSTGTDDYVITVSWITAYQDGMIFRVKSDVANTWACTLNVSGIWAKAVKKQQWTVDLEDGDWEANWIATLVYNSTLDVFQYSWQEATVVSSSSSNLQKEVTAWEWINALEVYRRWNTWIWEDETKFYKSFANNTDKLTVEWIASSTAVADSNFKWIFNWIVWGFSWLLWQDIVIWTWQEAMTLTTSNYPSTNRLWNTFEVDFVNSRINTIIVRTWNNVTWTAYCEILNSSNVVIWTSDTISIAGSGTEKTFNFSPWIDVSSWNTYHFNIVSASWSIPSYTYAQSWNYPNWQLVIWNTLQNASWDLYFKVNYDEIWTSKENDPIYLQDDWTIWVESWTNEVIIWNIFSDTEINFINRINWKQSTTATTWSITLWNAVWYITKNIPWVWNIKIPYYNI